MASIKKRIFFTTLGYLTSVIILLGFIYWFLKNEGFSESNFFIASIIVLALTTGWGYIIVTHLLAPKAELEASLSQLTSEILHELNIPLSTIKANATLLKKRSKDEKSMQRLERIEASSLRLERLYRELVYSINKEINPVEKEHFSLKQLLQERIAVFEQFDRNSFNLEGEDIQLKADKIGFEKTVDNLLMNAMKYSNKEFPVNIAVQNNILTITDRGIGMDETQLLRIYERYYQADSNLKGEGIGLALVKAYCDEESINIEIRSKKEQGTSVLLNLSKLVMIQIK